MDKIDMWIEMKDMLYVIFAVVFVAGGFALTGLVLQSTSFFAHSILLGVCVIGILLDLLSDSI